jgi:hypothetical protein
LLLPNNNIAKTRRTSTKAKIPTSPNIAPKANSIYSWKLKMIFNKSFVGAVLPKYWVNVSYFGMNEAKAVEKYFLIVKPTYS